MKHLILKVGTCPVLISEKFGLVRRHEFYDVILNAPLDEIQLRHGGLNFLRCSRNHVGNLLRSTEWVEQLFAVTQQRTLVGGVHAEHFTIVGGVGRVIFLCVVRDEPLQIAQGHARLFIQNVHQCSFILFVVVKGIYR
jgi:hypothetical protein